MREILGLTYIKVYNKGRIIKTGEINEYIIGIKQRIQKWFHIYSRIYLMGKIEFHMGRKRMN